MTDALRWSASLKNQLQSSNAPVFSFTELITMGVEVGVKSILLGYGLFCDVVSLTAFLFSFLGCLSLVVLLCEAVLHARRELLVSCLYSAQSMQPLERN